MSEYISISEAANILSLSIDTIRRWDKKGLIKAERNSKNERIFSLTELQRAYEKYIDGGE